MPTSEGLLALALPAVYLFDSAHFLCVGEAVISTRIGFVRGLSLGWSFELGGRRPYVPNPLTPFWPELRVQWATSRGAGSASEDVKIEMSRHLGAVRALGWISGVCGFLLILVAPLALALGQQRLFVAAAILCFLLSGAGCTLVCIRRKDLQLTRWQVCSTFIMALVCLPCAANLARAVSTHRRWTLAASDLPALGFDANGVAMIRQSLKEALASAQRYLPENSREHQVLSEELRKLGGAPHDRH
ncbi:MAG: hypothetical protein E6K43_03885 [Gammaproteobacteria bacterium]|nr:MAG: hypothetical protein E6K43_03885 [Gammaproteobacteria bacterium]